MLLFVYFLFFFGVLFGCLFVVVVGLFVVVVVGLFLFLFLFVLVGRFDAYAGAVPARDRAQPNQMISNDNSDSNKQH